MRNCRRRHRTAYPAGIAIFVAALVFSGASRAAIIVPVSGGGWATMTAISSVDTAKIVGSLKWTDALGNVKNFPTATLTRNLPVVAGVARSILARRLAVGAVVAGVLYESLSAKLGPDVKISPDGSAVRPGKTVPWTTCESNLISTTSVSGGTTKYNSYAFLPCQKAYVGPNRLLLRVPAGYGWTPDSAWLSQYGTPTITTRALPYILAGATLAITGSNFVEYVRPQTDTSTAVPSADTPVTDTEIADALMTPETIGQLAQADAIPQDFFHPIDLSVDTGTTPPTDGGSEIPDGPDVDDVSTSVFDIMSFVPQISLQWLPRHCPQWPDIPIVVPELHMDGAIEWPSDRICAVATDFISPMSRVLAIVIFVSIVFRKFQGGA
jgi:hypothetical protein